MTYDEVEQILSKPDQIVRGVNQLEYIPIGSYNYEELESIDTDSLRKAIQNNDTLAWMGKKVVNTIGNIIYVTWVFNDSSRIDTNYILIKNYREVIDTATVPVYYVNGFVVGKLEYERSKLNDYVRKNPYGDVNIIAPQNDTTMLQNAGYERITKKTVKHVQQITSRKARANSIREFYLTVKFFCITFDASSGRVVFAGYQPFSVQKLP